MPVFFLLAALLVAAALAFLLTGPLRSRASHARETDMAATNVSLARERRAELAHTLSVGGIDQMTHDAEVARLEEELARELDGLRNAEKRDGTTAAMIGVVLFVPVLAGVLYLQLGDPGAIERDRSAGMRAGLEAGAESAQAPAIADLLPQLEERLAAEPDDPQGWRLLGRSYLGIGEFEQAETALRRAMKLDENDVDTIGQLAEAIAMGDGGRLEGEPTALLERVRELDPQNPQGLWLLAMARQQIGEHEAALALFATLRASVPDDAGALATIDDMIARSREAMAGRGSNSESESESDQIAGIDDATDQARAGLEGESDAGVAASAALTVTVDVSDEAREAVGATDTVFVFARASEGPPMPLAVARLTVADLPTTVTLDESMAMLPAMTLARFDTVTVGARVSASGDAIASAGDWYTEQDEVAVKAGEAIALTIDQRKN